MSFFFISWALLPKPNIAALGFDIDSRDFDSRYHEALNKKLW